MRENRMEIPIKNLKVFDIKMMINSKSRYRILLVTNLSRIGICFVIVRYKYPIPLLISKNKKTPKILANFEGFQ